MKATSWNLQSSWQHTILVLLLTSYNKLAWWTALLLPFVAIHPKIALPKFHHGLREFFTNQTEFLLPTALIDKPAQDMFDFVLINEISSWFHPLDPGGNFLDWNTNFQAYQFAFFVASVPQVGTPLLNLTNFDPPEPWQYVYSYHTNILQAEIKNLVQNSNTAANNTLALHPFVAFHSNQWLHLCWQKRLSSSFLFQAQCHGWLVFLVMSTTFTQINLCLLKNFKKGLVLWPQNLPAQIDFCMDGLLHLELLNKSTLEVTNEAHHLLYLDHITHPDSKLAEYYFLHALLTYAEDSTSSTFASCSIYLILLSCWFCCSSHILLPRRIDHK